ncbi:MAG: tRNA A-37 threonylcarbamoyl transferase component Bud32 [Mariniblastus sp.]|jgi:tRNA A-37 threonylcarbamoyl transferase component Bud32
MKNNQCPQCKTPVTDELPGGLCPPCLMAAARFSQENYDRTQAIPGSDQTPSIQNMARLFPELDFIEFVGRGGMGAVYKVRQKNLDRMVALKVFLDRPDDPEFAARFQREARALARLNHPNIVTVHDFGIRDDVHYLIMEFIDGLNLRQLTSEERLAPEMALQMVPQLCDALQYAHDNGVIHRDIKPENLLLDTAGRINIADFGLAKMSGKEHNGTLTRTQQVMGTLNYMAPEQRERPTEVDHRADIYSLGVVIYELLTGELPIGRFLPPSSKSSVNTELDEVVMRALEKEPDRRYQQATEFKTGFESVNAFAPLQTPVPPVKQAVAAGGNMDGFQRPNGTRFMLSIMAGREKKGNWIPGNPHIAFSLMGAIELDLTEVEATEVNLTLIAFMGAVEVIVPHGATVDSDGFVVMGAISDKVSREGGHSNMRVRIRSWGAMGACEIRTPTRKETRNAESVQKHFQKQNKQHPFREPPEHDVTWANGTMMLYKLFALLVTFAIPVIFIADAYSNIHGDSLKMIGISTAIFAGFLWTWSDYLRILVGASPENTDSESLHKHHSSSKTGTLIRTVAMLSLFACPIFFVMSNYSHSHEEETFRFAGFIAGIFAALMFVAATKIEEFFFGKLHE